MYIKKDAISCRDSIKISKYSMGRINTLLFYCVGLCLCVNRFPSGFLNDALSIH